MSNAAKGTPLFQLRKARGFTQVTLAAAMDKSQGDISKLERQTDCYVSTLRSYIEAMGGTLNIVARFPDGDVRINLFSRGGADDDEGGEE